jgi:hypothetical protein
MRKKLLGQLVSALKPSMKEAGFLKGSSLANTFVRDAPGRIDYIHLGSHINRISGDEKCSVYAGIEYLAIETMLESAGDGEFRPTVNLPIHLLIPGGRFHEWTLTVPTLATAKEEIWGKISRYAFPFFASFSSVEALAERLSKNQPSEWLVMSPVRRAEVLTACLLHLNQSDRAKSFLQDEIARAHDKLRKDRLPLQRLHQRLFE